MEHLAHIAARWGIHANVEAVGITVFVLLELLRGC
jgi:hypothetical protein